MPIGSYAAIPLFVQDLIAQCPKTVLDLGIGFGGLGSAVRQWLDLGVRPWKTFLVGVECWADYRNPTWDLYDAIYVQTIEAFLQEHHSRYDLIVLGDVLEHFDKSNGAVLLNHLKNFLSHHGQLIVITPAKFFAQGPVYNNERERHRSHWSNEELTKMGFDVRQAGTDQLACGRCWYAKYMNR
jgi:predicted TPR repeat methyltransferase